MGPSRASVATGHAATTAAAVHALDAGGNAVDMLIAAGWTACVAEPIFCSPGGGGHALVRMRGRAPVVADFFAQTPRVRRVAGTDFYPIRGNFGCTEQEFHIGHGSAAVPGMVAGLFELHRRHAVLPMPVLAEPAAALARAGVQLNAVQREALEILEPIVRTDDVTARVFGLASKCAPLPAIGERARNPELGGFIEATARLGAGDFYRGGLAARIAACQAGGGGHISIDDLARYRVRWRRPMKWQLGEAATVWSNPPPAFGGLMVALMTRALERALPAGAGFGSRGHLEALTSAMRDSEERRLALERPECARDSRSLMRAFRRLEPAALRVARGTTQISARDRDGNIAGMTISNGEGCGRVVPGCGFMLNNMLGEEDLNRTGFGLWPPGRRLSSMMAPTMIRHAGRDIVLGSGGSNRIRTAIAQVLANLMHFRMDLREAVFAPRLHLEGEVLSIERDPAGWPADVEGWLIERFPAAQRFPGRSLFFGGVHAVAGDAAAADPRRLGATWIDS
ncbi:MAG: gamma-glutamyltransferase [Wenzhouxiangellaceae bacterium]|nr:gamma-glutamyltransferase [Wenzhouxiangellaceae bacterium]